MKRLVMMACVAVAALLTGCVATPMPPMDRRVTVAQDLGTALYVTDVRCIRGTGGHLTFQANVVNNLSQDLGVEWKVVWLDPDGIEMESLVSTWNKAVIPANDIKGLKGTAPDTTAADMRFYVRALR